MVTTNTMPVPEEPASFDEAWNLPNSTSWEKWQEAICKEFADMNKQQVWHRTSKSLTSPNWWCVKNKWVFKIKRNSVYQVRLITYKYSQVLDVNFSENYSSVVKFITFHILLLMLLHYGYLANIVNVETAFLYGDLK